MLARMEVCNQCAAFLELPFPRPLRQMRERRHDRDVLVKALLVRWHVSVTSERGTLLLMRFIHFDHAAQDAVSSWLSLLRLMFASAR